MTYWPWKNQPPQFTYPNYQPNFQIDWWYNCPYCGACIKVGVQFCPQCGKSLSITEEKPTLESISKKLDEILKLIQSFDKTANEEVRE